MAYIDRDKALLELQKFSLDTSNQYGVGYSDCLTAVEDVLNDLPTADVVEVKHGYYEYDAAEGQSFCSVCESPKPSNGGDIRGNEVRYCYYCGAKMDGGKAE